MPTEREQFIMNEIRPSELVEIISTQIEVNHPSEGRTPDYTLMGQLIWALIINQGPLPAFQLLYENWRDSGAYDEDAPTLQDALATYGLHQKMNDFPED